MKKTFWKGFRQTALDVGKLLLGSLLSAAAFRYLTFPNSIVSGGITGVAQILNLLIQTPIGLVTIVMNIPLFILAWRKLGRRFVVLSLVCMAAHSLFIDLLAYIPFEITEDPMLAAVYGGVAGGLGWGIVYTTGATGGGTDIPARLLRRRFPYLNFGMIQLSINAVIIVAFAAIFRKFESCMYTVICMYISAKVVDVVAYGPVNARQCLVISGKPAELESAITGHLGRGVTLLHGEGGWTGSAREVILCVVKREQIGELRKLIRGIDPHAFTIISDARGVYGAGFENITKED